MKLSFKFLILAALLFSFSFAATAQRGGQSMDPTEIAAKETARLTEELNLTDIQVEKAKEISLTYAGKLQQAKQENKGNRDAMKTIQEAITSEKTAEMKMILTEDQFKAYEALIAKSTTRKKGRGGRGGGRGGK